MTYQLAVNRWASENRSSFYWHYRPIRALNLCHAVTPIERWSGGAPTPRPDLFALRDGQADSGPPTLSLPQRWGELTLRPAFHPYPAETRVNTRRQPLVVSDLLEEMR